MQHQNISKHSFSFILDKMRKKMFSWKANSFSFLGRITLAQASLSSIPGYVMQTYVVPIYIYEEEERLCINFIWRSIVDQRKCHLISWSKICLPKAKGSLGFRSLRVLNKAYMMKLAWNLVEDSDKLWVRIVRAKYNCGSPVLPQVASKSSCSSVWRAIVGVWLEVEKRICWSLGSGN